MYNYGNYLDMSTVEQCVYEKLCILIWGIRTGKKLFIEKEERFFFSFMLIFL